MPGEQARQSLRLNQKLKNHHRRLKTLLQKNDTSYIYRPRDKIHHRQGLHVFLGITYILLTQKA
jgi:hypothetical protein